MASLLYGHHTQTVRDIIRGSLFGAGNQAHPRIWLTEGGARLSYVAGFKKPKKSKKEDTSPNTDQRAAKSAQQIAVGVAAEALKQTGARGAGRGVEMFTQFLFYDEPPSAKFPCGLLNSYAQGETSTQEKRPAYSSWKYWRL
ncbi:MAG: hypothetical protein M3Y17_00465 [Actinomycetota bacterium]|nr:hypothetical protein [Actinomycetota bacterium]